MKLISQYLVLALVAPLFFLATAKADAASPATATIAVLNDVNPDIDICTDLEARLDAIDAELTEKEIERARYQSLLNRYEAAGAGDSAGATAMRGFIASLDADIAALEIERSIIWALIVVHCGI